jgi:hypothetical protein
MPFAESAMVAGVPLKDESATLAAFHDSHMLMVTERKIAALYSLSNRKAS